MDKVVPLDLFPNLFWAKNVLTVKFRIEDANVGECGKLGKENGAMECPYGGTNNGTHDAVILEKGERSRAVRSYSEVTREYVKTPLGQNRLIIS